VHQDFVKLGWMNSPQLIEATRIENERHREAAHGKRVSIAQIVPLKAGWSVHGANIPCKRRYPLPPFASDEVTTARDKGVHRNLDSDS